MVAVIVVEKLVGVAVLITALIVGFLTIHHGDISLGLLVLLGQAQSLLGGHRGHNIKDEATHLVVHRQA